jgi:hypothetical protein
MSQTATLSKVDELIKDKFVPFRERIVDRFSEKHPHMSSMISAILANKENKFGMQVTENNQVVGEYTFHFGGMQINNTEYGKLDSAIQHPLMGVIKPYSSIERSALEKIIADEENIKNEPFSAITKYLPEMTIKFLH